MASTVDQLRPTSKGVMLVAKVALGRAAERIRGRWAVQISVDGLGELAGGGRQDGR